MKKMFGDLLKRGAGSFKVIKQEKEVIGYLCVVYRYDADVRTLCDPVLMDDDTDPSLEIELVTISF